MLSLKKTCQPTLTKGQRDNSSISGTRKFKREVWNLRREQEKLKKEIQEDEKNQAVIVNRPTSFCMEEEDHRNITELFSTAIKDFRSSFEDSLE